MHYVIYQDAKSEWRWRLKARNGRVLADSGEGYARRIDCVRDIRRVKRSCFAPIRQAA